MRRVLYGIALLCSAAAGNLTAFRQPSSSAAQTATIDFVAVAADGEPVTDLRTDELTIRVGRRPRRIVSIEWIRVAPPPRTPDAPPAGALPAPFGSNALTDTGRTLVIVIDDDSFRPGREQPLREAVGQFLRGLSGRDRVALVTLPYGGLKADFTTDRGQIIQALSRIVGQAPADQSGTDFAVRSRRTLESLTGLLGSFGGGSGPTAILFVSSALAAPRRDAAPMMAPGMGEITTDHYEQVGVATAKARAQFYVVLPEDVQTTGGRFVENIAGTGFSGSDNPLAGLEHLTGVTGGHRLPLLTARENNLTRITRETAGYYSVRFELDPSDRRGSSQELDVRVSRENVSVRSRPFITIPPARASGARVPSPRDMLRDAEAFHDLPLRAIGYSSQNEEDKKTIKVLALAEPAEPSVTLKAAGAGLFDPKGRLVAQWTANSEELAATPLVSALIVPPGRYRLRVAASDGQGRAGTADYEVFAELTPAGALTISGLVLGVSRQTGFRPVMQFSGEPVATGYIELYGQPAGGQLAVVMELSMTEDGPAIVSVPAALSSSKDQSRLIATAAIPVGALPAGDYVVRALVGTPGQPAAGTTSRVLRKVPKRQ